MASIPSRGGRLQKKDNVFAMQKESVLKWI